MCFGPEGATTIFFKVQTVKKNVARKRRHRTVGSSFRWNPSRVVAPPLFFFHLAGEDKPDPPKNAMLWNECSWGGVR